MAKLAHSIALRHAVTGDEPHVLLIDGEPFPWYIDADGITVHVSDSDAPGVTLRILAESVTVEDVL